MTVMRKAGLPAILLLTLLWMGCGDTYRPVANPILKPGGDPSTFHYVVSVNNNNGGAGTTTHVNASGDSVSANYPVGQSPVHAAFLTSESLLFVADQASDTLSFYTSGQAGAAAGTPANNISLPAGSRPVFVAAGSSNVAFVANFGTNSVGVVNTSSFAQLTNVPVGPNPVALVLSKDSTKLYCVNQGNGTVTIIATADFRLLGELTVGRLPVAAVLSPDGSNLYVLNQGSGTISVINTAADALVGAPERVGSTPTQLFVDTFLNRLYVTNRGSNSVSVFDISGSLPALVKTVPVGSAPVSVTVLGDGSRAYVANSGSDTVSVIDTASLTIRSTIPVGVNPVFVATVHSATSRVFVADYGPPSTAVCTGPVNDAQHPECYGFISIIDTGTDTVVGTPDPVTNQPPKTTLATGSPRPVFLLPSS